MRLRRASSTHSTPIAANSPRAPTTCTKTAMAYDVIPHLQLAVRLSRQLADPRGWHLRAGHRQCQSPDDRNIARNRLAYTSRAGARLARRGWQTYAVRRPQRRRIRPSARSGPRHHLDQQLSLEHVEALRMAWMDVER